MSYFGRWHLFLSYSRGRMRSRGIQCPNCGSFSVVEKKDMLGKIYLKCLRCGWTDNPFGG